MDIKIKAWGLFFDDGGFWRASSSSLMICDWQEEYEKKNKDKLQKREVLITFQDKQVEGENSEEKWQVKHTPTKATLCKNHLWIKEEKKDK